MNDMSICNEAKIICIICRENEVNRVIKCGHTFCASCIYQLRDNGTNSCPYCRVKFYDIYQLNTSSACVMVKNDYIDYRDLNSRYWQLRNIADLDTVGAEIQQKIDNMTLKLEDLNSKYSTTLQHKTDEVMAAVQHEKTIILNQAKCTAQSIIENSKAEKTRLEKQISVLRKTYWGYQNLDEVNKRAQQIDHEIHTMMQKFEKFKTDHANELKTMTIAELNESIQKKHNDLKGIVNLREKMNAIEVAFNKYKAEHPYYSAYTISNLIDIKTRELKDLERMIAHNTPINAKLVENQRSVRKDVMEAQEKLKAIRNETNRLKQWIEKPRAIKHEIETLRNTIKYQREWIERVLKDGKKNMHEFKLKAEKAVEVLLLAVTDPENMAGM